MAEARADSVGENGRRYNFDSDRKMECAAPSDFAIEPDTAAHQLHQLRRDCKPQAGSTISPCATAIGLDERLKNPLLLVLRNSNASIRDTKAKLSGPCGGGL